MARLKNFFYVLLFLAFLPETYAHLPGFYEPTLEYSKEFSETREEYVSQSPRKVKPVEVIIRRPAVVRAKLYSAAPSIATHPILDRTILYKKLLI